MNIMNKAEVEALFAREAVMLGGVDVVPDARVAALFGRDAVEFVYRQESDCPLHNCFGACGHSVEYLTYQGFVAAASCFNVLRLTAEE